jgi:phosphohistidine phosphatase
MARKIRKRFDVPDLFVSSPANRALETAHIFADALGYPMQKVLIHEKLYAAPNASVLWQVLNGMDDRHRSVALFGHDPEFSRFGAQLTKAFKGELPKAGILVVAFAARRWKDLSPGKGRLRYFSFPGAGKLAKTAVEKEIQGLKRELERRSEAVRCELPAPALQELKDGLEKTLRKVARRWLEAFKDEGCGQASGLTSTSRR